MKKTNKWLPLMLSASMIVFTTACNNTGTNNDKAAESKQASDSTDSKQVLGYIYTTTNGEGDNEVIQLARFADGTLGNEKTYNTGAKGGSAHDAPAHGDYDAQGQTKIVGNCLLTCNTGANSIAVFHINRENGDLHFVNNYSSQGTRPVTIGSTPVEGSADEFWVLVGNQWNTPTVIYDGDKMQRLPSDDFFK